MKSFKKTLNNLKEGKKQINKQKTEKMGKRSLNRWDTNIKIIDSNLTITLNVKDLNSQSKRQIISCWISLKTQLCDIYKKCTLGLEVWFK
jgi:hypothetical protein